MSRRLIGIVALATSFASSCDRPPDARVDAIARKFLTVTAEHDSIGLMSLAADSSLLAEVTTIRRTDPNWPGSNARWSFLHGRVSGDTAIYVYRIPGQKGDEPVAIRLVRRNANWFVVTIGFPD